MIFIDMPTFYGQKGEDRYLFNTFFSNKKNGVYIELGAMDGIGYSNTKFFEDEMKWTGILIEPNEHLYKKLLMNRPNNKLYNSLVSNEDRTYRFKYFEGLGVSCIEETMPRDHNRLYFNSRRPQFKNHPKGEVEMKGRTLQSIIDDAGYHEIDLLSLDVEGHEYQVLRSIDFKKTQIKVILVEILDDNSNRDEIHDLLLVNRYEYHSDIGRNRVYVLKIDK